jgi:phospholipase/lecithinase/hemolysin
MSLINTHSLGLNQPPDFLANSTPGLVQGPDNMPSGLPLPSPSPAGDPPFSRIFAFGDSLSDVGNIYTATLHLIPVPPFVNGHFSNGPIWVEDLAQRLGLPVPRPSLRGGTDFAYGGGETGQDPLHNALPTDLPSQLVQYAVQNPLPQQDALYTLSIGSNGVMDAVSAYPGDPATADAAIAKDVANETKFVDELAHLGARNFLILNVPDLGKIPKEATQGPVVAQTASILAAEYNGELNTSLSAIMAQDHLNLHLVDTYALIDEAVANPAAFGLTNVTDPVWTGNYYNPFSGHLNASGAAQSGYLFFGPLHPTATAHALLAAAAEQSLFGPTLA